MTPAEIRNATLSQLRAARTDMLSAEWTLALEGKDAKTQKEAAQRFLRVHHAVQQLENAELAKIRDALLENEKELAKGTARLGKALKNLSQVKTVLNAASSLLGVVAKIVPLLL